MTHPILTRLNERHGLPLLTGETWKAWAETHDFALIFFAGDVERIAESADVAVILPEILREFRGRLAGAVADTAAEPALRSALPFDTWPALIVVHRGHYRGAITRVRSWSEYLDEIERLLAASAPTGIKIPIAADTSPRTH